MLNQNITGKQGVSDQEIANLYRFLDAEDTRQCVLTLR